MSKIYKNIIKQFMYIDLFFLFFIFENALLNLDNINGCS